MRFALALLGLLSWGAQAQELRFTDTIPGGLRTTGNTLGLSKAYMDNAPGTNGSIGTFISLDPSSKDGTAWPAGTTPDWRANGSQAELDLPGGVEVLYAELVWGGSFAYGPEDVSAYLDDAIVLGFGSDTTSVDPSSITSTDMVEDTTFPVRYYLRSAEVTSFVEAHGGGAYTVSGVPGTQDSGTNSLNAAGWTLVVAYRNTKEPIRNVSIFVGGSFVDEADQQDYIADGFCSPPFGPVEGRVALAALEGDADLSGDALSIAETLAGPFVTLSGPNNPGDNFLGSQINGDDGLLNTSGSFGTVNHDPFSAVNVPGGRQGWDLTAVPLSAAEGTLANDQSSAVLRFDTTGDSFAPTLLAFEIDVKAPDFTSSSTGVSPQTVEIGDTLTVTATLKNTGAAPASNLQFRMAVDDQLELLTYTTDSSNGDALGAPVTEARLEAGVPAGALDVDTEREIEMTFEVLGYPGGGDFELAPQWAHRFVTCDAAPAIDEIHTPTPASVTFRAPEDTGTVDTGTPPGPSDTGLIPSGGCGCGSCSTSGASHGPWWATLGLVGLLVHRRRKI